MEGRFLFEPEFNPHNEVDAPFFAVADIDGEWHFKGLEDRDLRDQVIEEINEFLLNRTMAVS